MVLWPVLSRTAMRCAAHGSFGRAFPAQRQTSLREQVPMEDNQKGLALAISSSLFIGASFIVKKKGLRKASASGLRAGTGAREFSGA